MGRTYYVLAKGFAVLKAEDCGQTAYKLTEDWK